MLLFNEIIDGIPTDDNLNHTKYNIIKKIARKRRGISNNITFHILCISIRIIYIIFYL